jgi:cell surface protein SprA
LPLNLLPIFDWLTGNGTYSSTYNWVRGTELEDGTSLGNTIAMNRTYTLNGTFDMEKLYNHIPFLKKTNERFKKQIRKPVKKTTRNNAKADDKKKDDPKSKLPLNKNTMSLEVTLYPDSAITVSHNRKSKRLIVTAKTQDGKTIPVKFKPTNDNKIAVRIKADTATIVKLSITKKENLEDKKWYKAAQAAARLLMMVRNVNFTYRNTYAMSLPGFMPMVGDAFGQRSTDGLMSPGLDFAFGFVGDEYIDKANSRGWLLNADSIATPATTNNTEDLNLKLTLEPFRDFKIDLNANRTQTRAKSVQYMYAGNPTTQTGTFTMTTLSLSTAFEGMGSASNGFYSKTFEKFCKSLPSFREKVEAQYAGARYPAGTSLAGQTFDAANGGVNQYSADVMVPAFLNAYTSMGGGSLSLFPTLSKLLPNWSLRYSGLGKLTWFSDKFKSVTISHAYKSIYAVGSYSSFSTYMEYMNGLGFITNAATSMPIPNSMYNISQVSINEAFSPLLGLNVTLKNDMTLKMEYRTTRVVSLSMTSVQLSEATSKDWVVGMAYKIPDFTLFSSSNHRKVKNSGNKNSEQEQTTRTSTRRRGGFSHDLNLRLDISYRSQAAINRDIATMTSTATSGNNAFKLSFSADYTVSRLLTMSFYLDRQTNKPLLSNNSYPTTTQDFGFALKFSLDR